MTRRAFLAPLLLAPSLALSGPPATSSSMPVATFSIVARDAATGQLGAAVQSHWFSVGTAVPWVEAGVGAVCTQSFTEASYGPLGLALMKSGRTAKEALAGLVAADPNPAVRQVGMVDASGNVAGYTGKSCIAEAGNLAGEGFGVQANLMARRGVPEAMAKAYRDAAAAGLDLAERLMLALEAAEAAGGDQRGRQSAALVVVAGKPTGRPWADRTFDLRVDDAPAPLPELRRLLKMARAYDRMNKGDEFAAEKKWDEANREYAAAAALVPEQSELPFWQAVTLFAAGREGEALPLFRKVFAARREWADLVPRLPASGLLPDDPKKIARILEEAAKPARP